MRPWNCGICGAFIKRGPSGKCKHCGAEWDNGPVGVLTVEPRDDAIVLATPGGGLAVVPKPTMPGARWALERLAEFQPVLTPEALKGWESIGATEQSW